MRRWRRGVSRAPPLVILHRGDAASTPSPRRRIDAIAATPHRRHRRDVTSPTQVGVASPRVYVIDLLEDTVGVVEPPPDGVYEGQPAFSPVRPRQLATVVWSSPVWKSTSVSGARQFFTKSFHGDDAAALAPSSGEVTTSPRHRTGVASMAWRSTRRFRTNVP